MKKKFSFAIKNKSFFWIAVVTVLGSNLVFLYEANLVPASHLTNYLISRSLVNLFLIVSCVGLNLRPNLIFWQYTYTISAYIYMIQGSFFRPGYEFSYIQFLVAQSLFFKQSKNGFLIVHSLGTLVFLLFIYINFQENIQRQVSTHNFSDSIAVMIISFLVGWVAFSQLTKSREEKDKAQSRFLLVGKQAVNIIHDLKSLASAPQIYLDLLLVKKNQVDTETERILNLLKDDLHNMVKKTKDLYSMVQNREFSEKKESASETLNKVLQFMDSRLKNVDLRVDGYSSKEISKGVIELILLNLIYNTLGAFKKNRTIKPAIMIEISENKISYLDNAGGADDQIVADFNAERIGANSGLGLFLIWDAARSFALSVKLENKTVGTSKGLEVQISF